MSDYDWGFGDELREELRAEAVESQNEQEAAEARREVAARSMMEWTELVPEPKFGVLDFTRFPYQLEWYSDEVARAREVVWEKSTQVGMSTYAWRWAARRADQFRDTAIYVFPTDKHVQEFGDERIEPAIAESEYLSARITDGYVRNKHQKRIGDGWLYLRGSTQSTSRRGAEGAPLKRAAGAQSVAGDALVFDEYDDLDQVNLAQMERRLSGAKAAGREPRIRRFGVPSIEGYGIDAEYQRSDQRRWHVTCFECGLEQPVTWEDNVRWTTLARGKKVCHAGEGGEDRYQDEKDVVRAWRACSECETELDVANGRWIPTHPGRKVIGYHVSRLIVPFTDLEEIVVNSRKTAAHELEAFYNNDLGLPYSPAEAGLTREELQAACALGNPMVPAYAGQWPVTAGLDVKSEDAMHIRISELRGDGTRPALYVGRVTSFEEAGVLMDRYRVRLIMVDNQPERKAARAFQNDYPGRVLLVRYDDSNPEADPVTIDHKRDLVTVHRTEAIDGMMDGIRQGRSFPPSDPPQGYIDQMVALKRKIEYDTRNRPRRVYVKTGGKGDDYAHAETYDLVAADVLRMVMRVEQAEWEDAMPRTGDELGYEPVALDVYGPETEDGYYPGLEGF